MSMAWEENHRRYDLVNAALAEVARTGRPDIPADLAEKINEVFGDFDAFLCDVRRRWYLTFDARLDYLLENPPPDLDRAVEDLWRDLDRERPAVRVLLDAHPAHTAVDAHHRDVLFAAIGVDQFDLQARTRRVS
jgi:hypothetical protein